MPEKLCSYNFLKDILAKKKFVFHTCEIVEPILPSYAKFSCKHLLEVAIKSKDVMRYLPEADELDSKRVCKRWLVAIINTLDPTYFKEGIVFAENLRLK